MRLGRNWDESKYVKVPTESISGCLGTKYFVLLLLPRQVLWDIHRELRKTQNT